MTSGPTSTPEPENTPTGGAIVVDSGTTAENYVSSELVKARASLRSTQIASILAVLILGGYMLFLTTGFRSRLEPHVAAETAEGLLMQQIDDNGPELANQLKQKIPEFLEKTPDMALQQLPQYRQQLANRVEQDLDKYCTDTSEQLGKHLDGYLDDHKDQVKGLLTAGNDPAQVKQVGDGLKQTMLEYIKEKPVSGESIGDQIEKSLTSLQEVEKKVHRLATAKDLTPQEQKARHAIAVLTQGIDAHKEMQLMH